MESEITSTGKFKFIEGGKGEPLILLHGLLGALSNFADVLEYYKSSYNVFVLKLPIYDLSQEPSVSSLARYVHKFIEARGFDKVHLLGNSSGGHVALVYTLNHPEKVKTLILTGSSGLFENGMGETYPKRGDYEFIRKKTELTFYDPAIATKELVDDIYATVNNRLKAIKIIRLAKSAIRNNLSKELGDIKTPTCLIWGRNDTVTPPLVAEEFHKLLPDSELHWIDKCGHAPMMEVPEEFNRILAGFLQRHKIVD